MASANVVELTTENWETEVVSSPTPVLVDFWAPWCGPCRALGPTIDKIADKYVGQVKVGKLNTDDHPDVAVRYAITGIPQVLVFRGSDQPRERLVGARPEADIVKVVENVLKG